MTQRPAAPPAPSPASNQNQQGAKGRTPRQVIPVSVALDDISSGPIDQPDAVVIYGSGGIGKSTLAAYLPAPLFLDSDRGTTKLDVSRSRINRWAELRGKLAMIAQSPPRGVLSVVVDNLSTGEELAKDFVVETRTTEKGMKVDSIEGFGWGKGWQFVYDEMVALLADLDRIRQHGIIPCVIAHSAASQIPNPSGEDYLRWEPALYGGDKKGRGSVRELVKNWSDQTLFIGLDVFVQHGRGAGSGTRTIYTQEEATHVAKSRTKPTTIPYELTDPARIWRELGILK